MATGTRTTYTQTDNINRGIAGLIQMIDWTEAPLVKLLGINNASKFGIQNMGTKYEWQEDTMAPLQDQLAEALDNSETGVDVDNGSYFKAGNVLRCEDELLYVSSVSSNTLTVVRGFAGSTAASHADDTAVIVASTAAIEGADFVTGYSTTTTLPYNYTQILSQAVRVTGTEQVNPKYGITDTLAREIAKLIGGSDGMGSRGTAGTLVQHLERVFWHGQRYVGTATAARMAGGFNYFVTTNVANKAAAVLTRKDIEDKIRSIFEAGGNPTHIICDAHAMQKITGFYEKYLTMTQSEERGGAVITKVLTPFGQLEVVYSKWGPAGELSIIDKDKVGWVELRPFNVYERASVGDYMVKDVLGEYGFVVKNEKAHARIYGYSTTA